MGWKLVCQRQNQRKNLVAVLHHSFYWRGQDWKHLNWNFIQKQMTETESWLKKVRLIRNRRHLTVQIQSLSFSLLDPCLQISLPACQLHNFWKCCLLRFAVDIKAPLWRINRSWVKVSLFCEIVHVSTEHWTVPSLKKRSVTDPPLIDRFSSLTFSHHQ